MKPRLFPRGFLMSFAAIEYPMPELHRETLMKVGQTAVAARNALELAKASGNKQKIVNAEAAYRRASDAVEATETLIRNNIGVEYCRAEYLLGVRSK